MNWPLIYAIRDRLIVDGLQINRVQNSSNWDINTPIWPMKLYLVGGFYNNSYDMIGYLRWSTTRLDEISNLCDLMDLLQ
jgi:hypothetical protein